MGCYVEHQNKALWLSMNADNYYGDTEGFPKWEEIKKGNLPVVLVDNGYFLAAGIAYDEKEYAMFTDERDTRPKVVFSVPIEKLEQVSDIKEWLKRGV